MFGTTLEELISGSVSASSARWIALVREAPQTKAFRLLPDAELGSLFSGISQELARWLDGSADRNRLGSFFAQLGKDYSMHGISLSEMTLGLALSRKAIVSRLVDDTTLDNAGAIYSIFDAAERVADFFALGNYYLVKGFLESTIVRITAGTRIPKEKLVESFSDDLFYRS